VLWDILMKEITVKSIKARIKENFKTVGMSGSNFSPGKYSRGFSSEQADFILMNLKN
jgi:hypothetical protein